MAFTAHVFQQSFCPTVLRGTHNHWYLLSYSVPCKESRIIFNSVRIVVWFLVHTYVLDQKFGPVVLTYKVQLWSLNTIHNSIVCQQPKAFYIRMCSIDSIRSAHNKICCVPHIHTFITRKKLYFLHSALKEIVQYRAIQFQKSLHEILPYTTHFRVLKIWFLIQCILISLASRVTVSIYQVYNTSHRAKGCLHR